MTCKDGRIPAAKIAKGTVHGCGQRRDTDVIVEIEWEGLRPLRPPRAASSCGPSQVPVHFAAQKNDTQPKGPSTTQRGGG